MSMETPGLWGLNPYNGAINGFSLLVFYKKFIAISHHYMKTSYLTLIYVSVSSFTGNKMQ
jgi:hypothetical protein